MQGLRGSAPYPSIVHAELTLPPEPTSVRAARRLVTDELERLGHADAAYTAALLVSELVTNCVLHARTDITVGITVTGDVVRVSVGDTSAASPRQRLHGVESGTGRGLLLVDRMARAWGVDGHGSGKTVWFELSTAGDAADAFGAWDELAGSNG